MLGKIFSFLFAIIAAIVIAIWVMEYPDTAMTVAQQLWSITTHVFTWTYNKIAELFS